VSNLNRSHWGLPNGSLYILFFYSSALDIQLQHIIDSLSPAHNSRTYTCIICMTFLHSVQHYNLYYWGSNLRIPSIIITLIPHYTELRVHLIPLLKRLSELFIWSTISFLEAFSVSRVFSIMEFDLGGKSTRVPSAAIPQAATIWSQ